ncbi:MAG: serine/threonine-protein kinase [Cyanobacteria bacterium P01_D01_bin.36]
MQPAISIGTLLQNHYRIVQLLGQGGFGRTYLAEDQGRFNERCAIKEFVPIKGEDKFSDKATQLFQREASVLYQINHPQIPKFRATFEEEERLFLVQDYVEGPTFHEVLNQRRQQGKAFSESEIQLFLTQILPVLAHIHAKGIIHRDISPDNIILRQQDRLPVLIDFGVVKEVVTRMQLEGSSSQATTVGKAGYAPSEQMQTGRAYPSSDLYSLAVTAIVLLTGREPQSLFDDINFAWNWQSHAVVTPGFAQVLNRALSYRPGDRYQSVSEMAKALAASASSQTAAAAPANRPVPPVSQMKTVAVGRANPNQQPSASQQNVGPTVNRNTTANQRDNTRMVMPSEQNRSSGLLESPLAVGTLAAVLAAGAGFGSWAVVRSLGPPPGSPTPTITSLPPLGSEPEPTPTQVSPKPVEYQQPKLELEPDVTRVVEGNMRGGDTVNYPLSAEAGQSLSVAIAEEGVLLTVLGPNGRPVERTAERVPRWEGELKDTDDYTIQLSPVRGVSSSDYRLEVTLGALPEPEPEPIPEPTATPDPTPEIPTEDPDETPGELPGSEGSEPPVEEPPAELSVQSQRISFPTGATSLKVSNNVGPNEIKRYLVNAEEGQILTVTVLESQGGVTFDVISPSGQMVADASNLQLWSGFLPVGGDYSIDVKSGQFSEFVVQIEASGSVPTE